MNLTNELDQLRQRTQQRLDEATAKLAEAENALGQLPSVLGGERLREQLDLSMKINALKQDVGSLTATLGELNKSHAAAKEAEREELQKRLAELKE